MKLYWGPHTCAIGTHILLVEIGKPRVDIDLPPNLAGHLRRMKERPAMRRVMTVWGEN